MPRREGPGTRGRWRWPRTAREGRGQQLKASGSPGRGDTPPGPRPQPPAAAGTPGSRGRRAGPRPRPARGLRVPRRRVAVLSGGGSVSDLPKLPETAAARSPPRPLLVPVRVPSAPGPRSPRCPAEGGSHGLGPLTSHPTPGPPAPEATDTDARRLGGSHGRDSLPGRVQGTSRAALRGREAPRRPRVPVGLRELVAREGAEEARGSGTSVGSRGDSCGEHFAGM